jgi:hypothetical protein
MTGADHGGPAGFGRDGRPVGFSGLFDDGIALHDFG